MFLVSMLPTGCYVQNIKSIQFSTLHRLSMWGHRWIEILLLKFVDWYNHSNTNVAGFKCILNRFWCIIWRPKAIFFIKISTLHNGLHNKFGLYVFPIFIGCEFAIYRLFIVPNLKCIHTGFAMLCCDHSNKCLFPVTQQAEVLLNFFGECRRIFCILLLVVIAVVLHWIWFVRKDGIKISNDSIIPWNILYITYYPL